MVAAAVPAILIIKKMRTQLNSRAEEKSATEGRGDDSTVGNGEKSLWKTYQNVQTDDWNEAKKKPVPLPLMFNKYLLITAMRMVRASGIADYGTRDDIFREEIWTRGAPYIKDKTNIYNANADWRRHRQQPKKQQQLQHSHRVHKEW